MGEDFKVGDVVVCVDDGRDMRGNLRAPVQRSKSLRRGHIYRIAWVGMTRARVFGVKLLDDPAAAFGAWAADRFRKLPKADEQFTADMRACRPHRAGVLA